jgi:hypothetical protein
MSVRTLSRRESDSDVAVLENDSVSTEIVAAAQPQDGKVPEHRCGPGACNDCACQGFTGTSYICETCRHPYNHHA